MLDRDCDETIKYHLFDPCGFSALRHLQGYSKMSQTVAQSVVRLLQGLDLDYLFHDEGTKRWVELALRTVKNLGVDHDMGSMHKIQRMIQLLPHDAAEQDEEMSDRGRSRDKEANQWTSVCSRKFGGKLHAFFALDVANEMRVSWTSFAAMGAGLRFPTAVTRSVFDYLASAKTGWLTLKDWDPRLFNLVATFQGLIFSRYGSFAKIVGQFNLEAFEELCEGKVIRDPKDSKLKPPLGDDCQNLPPIGNMESIGELFDALKWMGSDTLLPDIEFLDTWDVVSIQPEEKHGRGIWNGHVNLV